MSIFSKLFGSKSNSNKQKETLEPILEEPERFDDPIQFGSTPDNLPEAIRYVIDKWGKDYLLNRGFINVLNDFKVLKDMPAAKHIITNMQASGYVEKITSAKNWELNSKSIAQKYAMEYGAKDDVVIYIVQCFGYGMGKINNAPKLTERPIQEQKTFTDPKSQPFTIPSPTTNRQPSPSPAPKPIPQPTPQQLGPYDPKMDLPNYHYPTLDLLKKYESGGKPYIDIEEQTANKNRVVDVLRSFGVEISSIKANVGPTITLYEITPAPGVRISTIRNLEEDIALSLSAFGVRIIAPIPGKGAIGIEVPNTKPAIVSIESILNSKKYQETMMDLPCAVGKTITNEVFMFDLTKSPHLLVAGAMGQGKSVCLNAIITSLLYKKHPAELKFVLIDPKGIEFDFYHKIDKHFLAAIPEITGNPIISNVNKVIRTLNSLCKEMDTRYDLLKMAQARNLKEYNKKFIARQLNPEHGHKFMPYIVVVIDEFGELIMMAGMEVELPIARIAQLARAVGIHMIIATQRPTTNIITGTIKANFPSRIAFRVGAMIDSRTILDRPGAQQLVGRGDMLYLNGGEPVRVQCAFVDTSEMERINQFIAQQQGYRCAFELPEPDSDDGVESSNVDMRHVDPMFEDAARLIVREQSGSTSLIQRKFAIGYNRANRLLDQLEKAGIVGAAHGSKPREVLIMDEMSLENLLSQWRS